jgi:predicted RNA-binding protein YlxR (DUF448 family)
MPNKSSNAGHSPQRTCVICRNKDSQDALLGFYLLGNDLVFDINRAVQNRKKYVCHGEQCLAVMDKWLARHLKKTGSARQKAQKKK